LEAISRTSTKKIGAICPIMDVNVPFLARRKLNFPEISSSPIFCGPLLCLKAYIKLPFLGAIFPGLSWGYRGGYNRGRF